MSIFHLDNPPFIHRANKILVHCHGCFDLIHAGHRSHLEAAKSYGDILLVTITADEYIGKGVNRPIYSTKERAYLVDGLRCVDFVAVSNYPTAVYAIQKIRPDVMVRGIDYVGEGILPEEMEALESVGAKLLFTQTLKLSTTEIIERCKRC